MLSMVGCQFRASDLATQLDTIMESRKQLERSVQAREFIEGSSCQDVPGADAEEIDLVTEMSKLICESPDAWLSHETYHRYTMGALQICAKRMPLCVSMDMDLSNDLVTAYVRNW